MSEQDGIPPRSRRVAVGCLTTFLGTMSGGMVAVLVSKFVAFLNKAPACEGIPTCDWYVYWVVGATIGGISLPVLVLRALNRPKQAEPRS